jgi:hypothetical protein
MKIISKVKQYDPSENKLFLDYTAQSEYAKFLLERKAIKLRAVWKGHTASIEIATVESILCDRHTDLKLQEQHSIVISAPRSIIKLLPEDFESEYNFVEETKEIFYTVELDRDVFLPLVSVSSDKNKEE